MPKKRNKENAGLPRRWQYTHRAYYFQVPPGLEEKWDGKKKFRLGKSLSEAYKTWAERLNIDSSEIQNIAQLLDQYSQRVVPKKSIKSQPSNLIFIKKLRSVFGEMSLLSFKPRHVYQYLDKRTAKTSGRREIEVLSHAFTKAVEWGCLDRHPFKNEIRLEGEKPRDRYIEDWELQEIFSLQSKHKKGSVKVIHAYLNLKLLTGLRRGDLLELKMSSITDEGIHVEIGKLRNSTGKKVIFSWVDENGIDNGRKLAVEEALKLRPCDSEYLFSKRDGSCYVDLETGLCHGWDSMWQRFVTRVLKETNVKERFNEHDIRAKAGSDADSLQKAQQLLTHTSATTTKRIYRRKPEKIS